MSKKENKLPRAFLTLALGILTGVAAKWLDLHTDILGDMFSHIAVWVLLAVLIAFHSPTPRRSALHVLLFLGGMVLAYYAAAAAVGAVWGESFLIGWGVVALLSAIPGYFVWYARGRSRLAWVLSLGVIAFQILATVVLFDRLRITDILVILLTAAVLLRDKCKNSKN